MNRFPNFLGHFSVGSAHLLTIWSGVRLVFILGGIVWCLLRGYIPDTDGSGQ
jgi:hypothetical protein